MAGNVVGMYTYQGQIVGVQLSQNAPVDPQGKNVYNFSSANFDYAAGTIAGLWYSWAKYYAQHVTSICRRRPSRARSPPAATSSR